ncbi:monovalent cation/H(+) antiporter subunit G [Streptomyces sp. NBC_00047]|uniref:monovalent cation/H(+) antiporter subunit G n=1 Tax=Streptomyces sp. NBC_00047 TaxID=2975627 RepID=UPI0022508C8F|nr:monovalent cation/H(+) antiporter subunit G [Streptomyces sp. NBC_00047]MCX5613453.1 monovalent cation/H(+) antiporter subunit G [Streptomyces sp. NBC_00047]
MTAGHVVALVLLWAGVGCVLLSAAGLALLGDRMTRLHALAPANGLGVLSIALSVAVEQGMGRAAVKTLFIGVLLALGGVVSTIAVGKATLEEQGGSRG